MTAFTAFEATKLPAAAAGLHDLLVEQAPRSEADRRLTPETVAALTEAGIFAMAMPQMWGGPEADPFVQYAVLETLARADGSAAWCAMIGCDGGYVSAYIAEAAGRALFSDISAATVFVAGPGGAAVPAEGGYTVSGQWAFASGSSHAKVFALSTIDTDANGPVLSANGFPRLRVCLFEAVEVERLDTWYTTGLRGTASGDVAVRGAFVPAERTFVFPPQGEPTHPGPLYRYPMLFATKAAAVYIGIAAAAAEDFARLAPAKMAFGSTKKLSELGSIQVTTANAIMTVEIARAGIRQALGEVWDRLTSDGTPDQLMSARTFAAIGVASDLSERVVTDVYHLAGRDGLLARGTLDRRFRDMASARQHVMVSAGMREATGRVLLGLPSGIGLL